MTRDLATIVAHGWWADATDAEIADWTGSTLAEARQARRAYRERIVTAEIVRRVLAVRADHDLEAPIGDVILDALDVYDVALGQHRRAGMLHAARRLLELERATEPGREAA